MIKEMKAKFKLTLALSGFLARQRAILSHWRLCAVALIGMALASGPAFSATPEGEHLDHIVAIVNNQVIVESELSKAIAKIKTQLTSMHTPSPQPEVLRKQVLEQLINKKIQLEVADQAGIDVTEEDLDKAISSIAKKNHLTVDQLYAELAQRGIDKEDYRKDIYDEYTIHIIQQKAVGSRITVSEQEVDDFMRSAAWQAHNNKEYHLEDILIALPEVPSPNDLVNAKKRAESLLAKLRTGAPFREAAVAESGSSKALQGGDLGWRKLPEIPSAFSSQILLAKDGDILGPIQTPNGFHIIHVVGIRNAEMQGKPANQHRQIQQLIFERKYEEALQGWITKIRGEAFINTHPEA